MTITLETRLLTKHFGGLAALENVDIKVLENSITSVIGPNGAGKTTFFNCVSGFYEPDAGNIVFQGQSIVGLTPDRVGSLGIGRTYQNIRLFANMTAVENVQVGMEPRLHSSLFGAIFRFPSTKKEEARSLTESQHLLEYVGLREKTGLYASNLPYGDQRRLEIARALAGKPGLLLLDEPTAGMNPQESQATMRFIQRLREELAITVLLIEHNMRVVMGISDTIYVLDYGEIITEGTPDEVQRNPRVIEAYLGRGAASGLALQESD